MTRETRRCDDPRIAFFDCIAPLWDGWHEGKSVLRQLQEELRRVRVGDAEEVLDVGCGTGFLTEALVSHLGPQGRVYALDFSPAMLACAKRKVADARVEWIESSAERIPLGAGVCDRAVCYSAWPHFRDQAAVVGELNRVLRPGGYAQILHLISREEVNRIHAQAKEPAIRADLLAPVADVAACFERFGFSVLETADDAKRFSLLARKSG